MQGLFYYYKSMKRVSFLEYAPQSPGVYIMRNAGKVIYVGKAVNLHNRVRSYFRRIVGRGPQIDQMVKQIARFDELTK